MANKKQNKGSDDTQILRVMAQRLYQERSKSDLTQEDLANQAKLSHKFYASLERGLTNISVRNLDKIARALNVPTSALLAGR